MKTEITNEKGVVVTRDGDGFIIENRPYTEAPFEQRWDDLNSYMNEGPGATSLTYEAFRDTGFFMRFFRHNQNDIIFMTYQMSHMWDPTTGVRPHMHYIPMSSGSGDVKFNFAYTWININDVFQSASGWVSGSVSASLDPSMQYVHKVLSFGEIVPDNQQRESSMLLFKVERPAASDASDTYVTSKDHQTAAANLGTLFFDLHYRKIKAGTITEY